MYSLHIPMDKGSNNVGNEKIKLLFLRNFHMNEELNRL